jgi:site-specific DNA recombinase
MGRSKATAKPGVASRQVALYVRVSTREQAEEGQSIEAQLAALRAYCTQRGLEIGATYIDAGESARSDQRPEFQRMIAEAKEKGRPWDTILVHKLDRFARSTEDAIIYKALLRRDLGIQLISISEPFDDSPAGRLTEHIFDAIAEFYSANLANEVLKGMRQLASKGRGLGLAPIGYRIGPDGRYVIDPETAPIVQWIYDEYTAQRRSMPFIAQVLRNEGVQRFGASAAAYKWSPQHVRQILTNRAYLGEFHWRVRATGEAFLVPNAHPPLVTPELFHRAQALIQTRRRQRTRWGDYLLKGFGRCPVCGSAMSRTRFWNGSRRGQSRAPTGYRDWITCSGYYNYLCPQRPPNAAPMDQLERAVVENLLALAKGRLAVRRDRVVWRDRDERLRHRDTVQRKLAQIPDKLRRQVVLFEEGLLTLEEFRTAKARVDQERADLEAELQRLEAELQPEEIPLDRIQQVAGEAARILLDETYALDDRRRILSSVLDHFTYNRQTDELQLFLRG